MTTTPDALRAYRDLSSRIDALRDRSHDGDPHPVNPVAIVVTPVQADFAACLMARARVRESLGRHEDALADYDDALHVSCQTGSPAEAARCLLHRAICLMTLGRPQGALVDLDGAVSLYREVSMSAALATCLLHRARCLAQLTKEDRAQHDIAEAKELLTTAPMARPCDPAATPGGVSV